MDDNRFEVLRTARVTIVADEKQERYDVIYYFDDNSPCASVEYFPFDQRGGMTKRYALKAAVEFAGYWL